MISTTIHTLTAKCLAIFQEYMGKNWKSVLMELYRQEQESAFYDLRDSEIVPEHPLVKEMDLTWGEVKDAVHFLKWNGLIEKTNTNHFEITEKGFDVARNEELSKSRVSINFSLVGVTAILALTSTTNMLMETSVSAYQSDVFISGVGTLILIVLIGFVILPYRHSRNLLS